MLKQPTILDLVLLSIVVGFGCSAESDPLSARAGRPSPEQVNKILQDRYHANENIGEQIEAIGGRIELGLDLSYTGLTDEDLRDLNLPQYLTRLNLSGTAITDEGLGALKGCVHLQSLNLDHTRVTDECLKAIKELPTLYQVNLNGTQVSPNTQLELVRFLRTRRPVNNKAP